ncbi:MAG: putative hydroxylase [Microbacteriaceae bacterium]|jgi:predicted enzyme related to lactoylglutathione lyase|nr:putative hydroxylase [Microbacteriaceae bacterium]
MPNVASKPAGAPIWIELSSTDPVESARFYGALLGTTVTEPNPDFGGYRNLLHGDALVAGLMDAQNGMPSSWVVYLLTNDIDETITLAEQHGGGALVSPMDIMGLGKMAFAQDPSGAYVGLWQPGTLKGIGIENEPGTPSWYELHTTSAYPATIAFYEKVFGWTTSVLGDSDEFRMVTFGEGRDARAGIYDASTDATAGTASAWQVYFAVDDADRTADVVRAEGGTVLDGPVDTPFGRISHAIDSTGAAFTFMRLPERPA